MRLAQLSDLHYTCLTMNPFSLFSKRLLGHLNWFFLRKKHFFESQIDPLPSLFEELKVDAILIGGDFSTTSLKKEFQKAKGWVQKLNSPWLAIPGNHDHYTKRSCRQKHFYRFFTNQRKKIEHPVEFFNLKEHRVEAHKLTNGWWIVALDTAIATNLYSSQGVFSEELERSLSEVLNLIPQEDQIIMMNHYPFFQNDAARHNLIRGEKLQTVLEKTPRIRMYLHGHTHRQTVADLQVDQLPLILDSGSCAQGRKGAWNLIDLSDEGCSVSTYKWTQKWTKTRTEEFTWTR